MDFIEKIKLIIGDSNKFYDKVSGEDLGEPIKYLLLVLIIPTVLIILLSGLFMTFVLGIIQAMPGGADIPAFVLTLGPLIGVLFGVFYYISTFVGSFIHGAILHVIVYLMGAKKGFQNTYKAVAYGQTPNIIFGWIPLLNIVFGIWSWYLVIKGLSKLQDMTMGRAFLATIIPIIVLIALAVLGAMMFAIASSVGSAFDPSMFPVN